MKWTRERCIEELRLAAVGGVVSAGQAQARATSLPTMCGRHYGSFAAACEAAGLVAASEAKPRHTTCTIEGCCKPVRSGRSPYCEVHYYRHRRNGTFDIVRSAEPVLDHSNGYKILHSPGHPLCTPAMKHHVYEHRAVYHAEHGDGPFNCHHCGAPVTWDDMHVDHLNDVRDDNRIENLAASCPTCNQWRGKEKMKATMREKHARRLTLDGVTLSIPEWAERLGIRPTSIKWRLANGWTVERALTEGRGKTGPQQRP